MPAYACIIFVKCLMIASVTTNNAEYLLLVHLYLHNRCD